MIGVRRLVRRAVLPVAAGLLLALGGAGATPPAQALTSAPIITGPAAGTLPNFNPTLRWVNPAGATQVHLQVTPANNDGAGLDIYLGEAASSYTIPPPPQWYGLLPGMTYTWRVRASDAATAVGISDASWGAWVQSTFRTPDVDGGSISAASPVDGAVIATTRPTLLWTDSRPEVFYYELQLSADPGFTTDPAAASAPVYGALLHGALTRPVNSFALPSGMALTFRQPYYWRVRPRIQGDGAPAPWSKVFQFRIDSNAAAGFGVDQVVVGTGAVAGNCTPAGAADRFEASPTLSAVRWALRYSGAGDVVLALYEGDRPYPPLVLKLDPTSTCRSDLAALADEGPARPGAYRLDIWAQGNRIRSAEFTIADPAKLTPGALTVGTGASGRCGLVGAGATFTNDVRQVYVRWATAGAGTYTVTLLKDSKPAAEPLSYSPTTVACQRTLFTNLSPGTWVVSLAVGNNVVQQATFTIAG